MVSANGAVVDHNVPSPESDGVPLRCVTMASDWSDGALLTFLTSNFFLLSAPASAAPGLGAFVGALALAKAVSAAASGISTSAILSCFGIESAEEVVEKRSLQVWTGDVDDLCRHGLFFRISAQEKTAATSYRQLRKQSRWSSTIERLTCRPSLSVHLPATARSRRQPHSGTHDRLFALFALFATRVFRLCLIRPR